MPRASGTAQVGKVQQPQHSVLAALQRKVLHVGSRRRRKNSGSGAADIGIAIVERRPVRRRVTVERLARVAGRSAGAVGLQRNHRLAPVVNAVEATDARRESIAGCHQDPIGAGVVEDAGPRPDRVLARGAGRRRFRERGEMIEVQRLVAARGVEHLLRAGGEVDRGDVALVVAVVARVSAVHDIKVVDAGGGSDRQRR